MTARGVLRIQLSNSHRQFSFSAVIASEAKQSTELPVSVDCFVAALLAMTQLHIPAARSVRVLHLSFAHQRAQGMPGARCARSLACKIKKHTSIVTTVTPESPGIPRAMVLTVFFVLSPVNRAFLPPSPADIASADLTPASGCQDHTTSPSASSTFVFGTIRVHRIPPRVCDDRETPLCGTGRCVYN
jgi:hypothetical protein